jgi:exopolyphosphatase/guanosine-5'-triphosphate,3'-diphosphate pyrophosphatase
MGSNTFHLTIKGIDALGTGFDLFSKQCHVKIAEGGLNGNKILPIAQGRAIKTLREFKGLIDELGVDEIVAFATSAFRDALNTEDLVAKGSQILDSDIEIISGKREAELIFKGVTKAYKPNSKPYLVVDIGGGSVEFIIGLKHTILWSQSLPIGGLRLSSAFQNSFPMTRENKRELIEYLQKQLADLKKAIDSFKPKTIVGAAGAFATLSRIEHVSLKNKTFPEFAKSIQINLNSFTEVAQLIKRSDRSDLNEIPGMHDFRAEQMPVSVVLIEEILKLGSFKEFWYSDYAMKEGIFYEYLEHNQ